MSNELGTTNTLVRVLTASSFGLGIAEVVAPARLAALAGVDDNRRATQIIRAFGLRECATGVALIAGPRKVIWARVAGDALDLGALLAVWTSRQGMRRRRCATALVAIAGVTAADVYTALRT